MSKSLFVIGTGTDVGKTYVSGLILKKLHESGIHAAYYKAAMSGNEKGEDGSLIPGDALWVKEHSGIAQPLQEMCPFVYESAVSPHLASRLEGNPVDLGAVMDSFHTLKNCYEYITMEGSGGVLCPLRFDGQELWLPDVIRSCGFGCLLVADAGLGTINQAGLTAFFLRQQNLPLKGVILNHYEPGNVLHEDNKKMCKYVTGVKVVACVQDGDSDLRISIDELKALYEEEVK